MSGDYNLAKQASEILVPPPKCCRLCGIELQSVSAHLSKDHCLRDLIGRVAFLRQIIAGQTDQCRQISSAIVASQRFAYAILHHLTEGRNELVLDRADFENLPGGCAVTMEEIEDGTQFRIVGVVPSNDPAKPS